ncbi:type II secretion system GspH family protein [bacterium]|nr:type II secretion system GspH family protein [bacterium]
MRKPYTLVEILVAVSIIGILTATGLGITSYVRNKVAETQTKTTIKLIEMAFQKYNDKTGNYPLQATFASEGYLYFPDITNASSFDPIWSCFNDVTLDTNGNTKIRGIRVEYNRSERCYYILDGWNHKLVYANPGCFNSETYDLISFGSDNSAGTGEKANYKRVNFTTNMKKALKDPDAPESMKTFLDKKNGSEYTNYPEDLGDDVTNFTRN